MTEGIGFPYEKTFVGLFDSSSKLKVANMSVASYSPNLYLKKIKYYLNEGMNFNHLIVGVDLTDLGDDWNRSKNNEKKIKKKIKKFTNIKALLQQELPITFFVLKKITWFYKFNFTEYSDHLHLDYYNNGAAWSYVENYKNLEKKINIMLINLNELHLLLKAKKIKFSLLIFPHQASILYDKKNSLYANTLKEFCKVKCDNFIDGYNIFFDLIKKSSKAQVAKKYFIPLDSHLNANGHRIISNILINKYNNYDN